MNYEKEPHNKNLKRNRLAPLAGFMTLAIGIAGCGGGSTASKTSSTSKVEVTAPPSTAGNKKTTTSTTNQQESTSTTKVQQVAGGILMKPILKDCGDTAATACFINITENYKADSPGIIIDENVAGLPTPYPLQIVWPRATATGRHSDAVSVECYATDGESTAPPLGGQASTDWYEIAVPVSRVTNPTVLDELKHPGSTGTPPITSFDYHGVQSVNGWAPIVYFNQLTPASNVPECKTA